MTGVIAHSMIGVIDHSITGFITTGKFCLYLLNTPVLASLQQQKARIPQTHPLGCL